MSAAEGPVRDGPHTVSASVSRRAAPVPDLALSPEGTKTSVSQRELAPMRGADREERSVTPLRVGEVLSGRYRLEEKVGEGGMGAVFVAHDLELDRRVAVKLLPASLVHDAEVVERFEREARLTAKLDHPNIVPVYDVGSHEDRPYIVMKLLEGDTLAGILRTRGGFTSDETLKLMKQLAAGVDYIHSRGFIHRDIKAGNIVVGSDGHATILDFGILRHRSGTGGLTRTGMVMGTPHYMAPEQALGLKDVDHRVDLYALGVVLFEVLTGTLPFEADSELRLIQMQAHAPPPEILERAPWISGAVAQVVRRALAKRPDDRFSSGAELAKALESSYRESKGHPAAPKAVPSLHRPAPTSPSWRNRHDPAPDVAVAATADDALPVVPVAPPPPRPRAGPANAAPLERANTDDLQRMVRRRWLPWSAVAAVAAALGATLWWFSWNGSTAPVANGGPGQPGWATADAAFEATTTDAGAALVLGLPDLDGGGEGPDEASPLAALGDGLDAGEAAEDLAVPGDGGRPGIAAKAPKKRPGRLNVVTTHAGEPYWAQVSIDGVPRGRTPLLLDLPAGRYQLRVERAGFRKQEREIRVASGKATVLRIDLIP